MMVLLSTIITSEYIVQSAKLLHNAKYVIICAKLKMMNVNFVFIMCN